MNSRPKRPGRRALAPLLNLLLIGPILLYVRVLLRTAWLSDDAYISFRSIDNLLRGLGPVWNAGERVQSFSHPLWFFLLTPLRAATGEFYYSTLGISIALAIAAILVLAFTGFGPWNRRFLVVLLCCFSGAFVDYSTSGLENPLSHLLLSAFFFAHFHQKPALPRSFFLLAFLVGLATLNRLDTILIYLPSLIAEVAIRVRSGVAVLPPSSDSGFWHDRSGRPSGPQQLLRMGLIGVLAFTPFILWEIFSVIYYGFPFPNTAYAKLNTGIPHTELLAQGFYYGLHSLKHDPTTLGVLLVAIGAGLSEGAGRAKAFAVGILLYLAYVVWIGGDFMAGRFLSLPFFASVLLLSDLSLSRTPRSVRWIMGVALAVLALASVAIAPERTPILSGPDYPKRPPEALSYDWRGVGDERGAYYPWTGLLREKRDENTPETHFWGKLGAGIAKDQTELVVLPGIGLAGWQLGGGTYAVDLNALTDPLLARLPAVREPAWRIGHFARVLPPGYIDSLMWREPRIQDPNIAPFYQNIRLVTRGPIFSKGRFKAIWELNRRKRPLHPDWKFYQYPPANHGAPARRHYRAEAFSATQPPRTLPGGEAFAIYWEQPRHESAVRFSPRPTCDYDVIISRRGLTLGRFIVRRQPKEDQGGPSNDAPALIALPGRIADQGWDKVAFVPRQFAGPQLIRTIRPQNVRRN